MSAVNVLSDNDPWTAVKHPHNNNYNDFPQQHPKGRKDPGALLESGAALEDDELFSPQAQYQLAEFDLLRSEIENESVANNGALGNNGGK